MTNKTEPQPSIPLANRRTFCTGDPSTLGGHGRVDLGKAKDDGKGTPEQRLAEHLASMRAVGPGGTTTVRVTMRTKLGDERPTVRKLYDRATKPKRRRRKEKA